MANSAHLEILKQGVEAWNAWRKANPGERPELTGVGAVDQSLCGIDFSGANLTGARFMRTDLSGADLHSCDLTCANLMHCKLNDANLEGANLFCANFARAELQRAKMRGSILIGAFLVEADLTGAELAESLVYGASAWNARLDGAVQFGLVITGPTQPKVTVDHLEMAQFLNLVLRNENIRNALDTLTSKLVLILGRFSNERKAVLDALRAALGQRNYVPVIFDFEKAEQTTDETISTLAHLAHFVIADLTDAKSVLQELTTIVPNSPSVIIQPILLESQDEPGMFDYFRKFPWVLEPVRYTDQEALLAGLDETIIAPIMAKAKELAKE